MARILIKRFICDRQAGAQVWPELPTELVDAILTLALDPAIRGRMAAPAHQSAIDHSSMEAMVGCSVGLMPDELRNRGVHSHA